MQMMTNGEPDTARAVRPVREGVRAKTASSAGMAWQFLPYESRSISENVTWGMRKRFSDGKVSMPYKHFLGYEKGEDGKPKVVEAEAKIVRMIYRMFVEGQTPSAIARYLVKQGIPSPAGKKTWETSTVRSILQNEKYKGDALLQKGFTVDFLTKTRKDNEGEIPQYYVEGSHEC